MNDTQTNDTRELQKVKTDDFKQYIKEAQGLERNYIEELEDSRRNAWRTVVGLCILSAIAFLVAFASIRRDLPVPLVLRVDNATGAVDVLTTMRESEMSYGEIVDIYWLNIYILNRESYDFNNIQMLYDTTALLSTADVQKEYYAIYEGPNARDKILGDRSRIIVNVRSITPNKNGQAVVRFSTRDKDSNNIIGPEKNFIATVSYKYTNAPISSEDRRINPLGFQVTSYRTDQESLIN